METTQLILSKQRNSQNITLKIDPVTTFKLPLIAVHFFSAFLDSDIDVIPPEPCFTVHH